MTMNENLDPIEEKSRVVIVTSYPRRYARLIGYIAAVISGVFYITYPPITAIMHLDSDLPPRLWGLFFLLGGATSLFAWVNRALIVDRIGLSLIGIGLVAAGIAETSIFIWSDGWTRGGSLAITIFVFSFVVSRWQDVKHDEKVSAQAIKDTGG